MVSFIGILDIFGFEIMVTNSFEQLCINFANECLQKQFNENVFVLEKERYEEEGLDPSVIVYQDNQSVIDVISKKPFGLFVSLEEHGMMNRNPDNKALLQTFHKNNEKHENYAKPRFGGDEFIIKHFAGDVSYDINGFIEKNNDSLNKQLLDLMKKSTVDFVANIFNHEDYNTAAFGAPKTPVAATSKVGTMAAKRTVSSTFREQLDLLVKTLHTTDPSYIKCVKPNGVKMAGGFSNSMVVEQLRYSGVLEVVRIGRQGYPVRMPFSAFFKEFEILLFGKGFKKAADTSEEEARDPCVEIGNLFLAANETRKDLYQVGKTKMFLRDGVLEELHHEIRDFYAVRASKIQGEKVVCCWRASLEAN